MKRLKVSHKGTHKIAHLQKGARHSFARTKRTRKKAPACLKQIAATSALPCGTHQLPAPSYPYPPPPPCRTPRVRQGGGGGYGNSALTPIPGQQMTRHRQREPPIPRKRGRGASAGASSPRAGESGRRWRRDTKAGAPAFPRGLS